MRRSHLVLALAFGSSCGLASAAPVGLQNASATFSQTSPGNFPAAAMIDGDVSSLGGWAIYDAQGVTSSQTAVFETAEDITAAALQIDLLQVYRQEPHVVGRYRISVTADPRSDFADGLQTGGDVTANWTVLAPFDLTVPANTTYSVLPDSSVLMGGAALNGTYSGIYVLPFGGITGIRLEVIDDDSLPTGGPGRYPGNGNFVVTEFTANTSSVPAPSVAGVLCLGGLMATRRRRSMA